jgi:hypothetical protein
MKNGDTMAFGGYKWQVLAVKKGRILMISKDIIDVQWYHQHFVEVTWAECSLRHYLNNEFYNRFTPEEKAKIVTVTNSNPDNPWFKTKGGTDTTDRIFLLSLEEVCEYFGDSVYYLHTKGKQKWMIDDENNSKRQAKFDGEFHWWRLRSPGYYGRTSASVNGNGNVYVRGNGVHGRPRDGGGVRPALWLKLTG